jgi:hypothetical protein
MTRLSQLRDFKISELYERDFDLWLQGTIKSLTEGRYMELDIPNLIEEIEAMGRSERSSLKSNLVIILLHLLKWKYQPTKRSASWELSIIEHRRRLRDIFENSPSLKRYFEDCFEGCYGDARKQARIETQLAIDSFPNSPPFTTSQCLDEDFLPD